MFNSFKLTIVLMNILISGNLLADETDRLIRKANRYFAPLAVTMPGAENDTAERIALGKKLYFDPRLSINNTQSCASCHPIDNNRAGMDNLPTSPGAHGKFGNRNTPTVLNAGWQFAQFWDGRAKDLADQAGQPILNPVEMAMPDEKTVVDKLSAIDEYQNAFALAYPEGKPALTYANMAEAIAAFERTLVTESRFDDFLNGNKEALTQKEQTGLATFISTNCVRCHDGPLVGGNLYEKLGVYGEFHNTNDLGRFEVTKKEEDRMVFKVAPLRNIALTAPYFHDGSEANLNEVTRTMSSLQLDVKLSDDEAEEIYAFLKSLTGKKLEPENQAKQ